MSDTRRMFDRIAPSYDRLNHLMSMNVDRRWRRISIREIVDGTPQRILDLCRCGIVSIHSFHSCLEHHAHSKQSQRQRTERQQR